MEFSRTGTIDRLRARLLRGFTSIKPVFITCEGSNVLIFIFAKQKENNLIKSEEEKKH